MKRALLTSLLVASVSMLLPGAAHACSQDDTAYFDGFLDTSCLDTLSGTTLDTFGGLRLKTSGTPSTTSWDTAADLDTGITWDSVPFAPVGLRTLETDISGGNGGPARLVLPPTLLPLEPDGANPVLSPAPASVLDNDNIDDPAVAKVGSTYLMWYSGTAEDGDGPAIFLAESSDGQTWARANGGTPVLAGDPGAFDEHGVFGPDVIHDSSDSSAPYKMWYSGRGEIFGAIGYATSTDGVAWTKHDDPETAEPTDPVLDHGSAGSPDSFAAADPAVLRDGTTWKMWYTGDDSNKRRVAYATSPDGIAWTKGGKVISPEDPGSNANYEFGAWAPTVWKTQSGFEMLLAGRKNLGTALEPVFQTRIMNADSSDGISWSAPSPTLNPQSSRFDASNLNSPDILEDPGSPDPYKLYYSGNAIDANGNFHSRIGLATSQNGNSFSRFDGPVECLRCVLDIGALGEAFDGRQASGLALAEPPGAATKFVGFYWGNRGSDFKPRLGEATSPDGSTWTKVPVSEAAGDALFPLGNGAAFDKDGQRDPSVLYEQNGGGGADDYFLYFTGLKEGIQSIGLATAPEQLGTVLPDNESWSARSQILAPDGGGFDASGVSHPSIIEDTDYVLYYTGTASGGATAIGRAVSPAANGPDGPFGAGSQITLDGSQTCDPNGARDPVVVKAGAGDYRMLYTGLEKLEGRTIERGCYATSEDGVSWTRQGVALNPSQLPHSADEAGVEPTGMLIDGSTVHVFSSGVDRTGRTRGGHATGAFPTPTEPVSGIPNGWATYQLGNESTTVRDFRSITRTSSGSTVTLWMSFEQPYSSGGSGNQFWSDYFPVTVENANEALSFLLTVRGVRWQARLSDPSGNPALDKVEIEHAPVQFTPAGSATTHEISPPEGVTAANWASLTVSGEEFSPTGAGTASGTVKVLSADGIQELAAKALSTNGDTTIDLSGVSTQSHPSLRVRLDLSSAAPFSATPLVRSLKVLYNTGSPPPPPPPPAPAPPPPPPVVKCLGKTATIVGTARPDVLKGTGRADVIAGLGGNDRIYGLRGNDRICGGGGKDRVVGGAGKDRLGGQAGPDLVKGGAGADIVLGNGGRDRLDGGPGPDRLFGGGHRDVLIGGRGRPDVCNGGPGRDRADALSCEKKRRIP
ncbi:MAG TPA: hypothetical protein VFZ41_05655 [Solirubrobacterales bacterium]